MQIKKITIMAAAFLLSSTSALYANEHPVPPLKGKDIYECGNFATALAEIGNKTTLGVARNPLGKPQIFEAAARGYFFVNFENCQCWAEFHGRLTPHKLGQCFVKAKAATQAYLFALNVTQPNFSEDSPLVEMLLAEPANS